VLVKDYPEDIVKVVYQDLKTMIEPIVEKRNGRIWNWAGDGMLAAFYFSNKNNKAVVSAMEIIHEVYLYNLLRCPLDKPLQVRVAVHCGPCEYRENFNDLKSDTLEKIVEIEKKHTDPNSVTLSSSVYQMLSQILAEVMQPVTYRNYSTYYTYRLQWES
jgi:class 3 adenylate cyclase